MLRRASSAKSGQSIVDAIQQGNSEQVSCLLKKIGSSKRLKKILQYNDPAGQTPIHVAASNGQLDCVKLLLEEHDCINSRDGSQWTPLLCAAANSHFDICSHLLSASCDSAAQNKSGTSALHQLARKTPSPENEPMYKEVLDKIFTLGTNPDIANRLGETPLHQASMRGNLTAVQILLDNNADANICTNNEETALHFAVRGGNEQVVDLLLANGSDPKAMGNFGSALDVAISTNQEKMISKLSKISNENMFSEDSTTPNLFKVLKHPELCMIFFYYLQKQYCAENLSFYFDVSKLARIDDAEVESTAKGIVSKYIQEGSLFEINIDHKTRNAVLASEEFTRNMFDRALNEVMILLENDSYQKFIRSSVYTNFLEGKTLREDKMDAKAEDLRNYFVAMIKESRNVGTNQTE